MSNIWRELANTPTLDALRQRVECGGGLSLNGIAEPAYPFITAYLAQTFPTRPIVAVLGGTKAHETFHQDLQTWLNCFRQGETATDANEPAGPLFYPNWDVLPHEEKLPHTDVISERLEALLALLNRDSSTEPRQPPIITTTVTALLQRTLPPSYLRQQTRTLAQGDQVDPLTLMEWLEAQGYESEAQVTGKGEMAMRGGIIDLFPLPNPWPIRLEFFGDELESLRYFDPVSQMSRDAVTKVTIPPAGELELLKEALEKTQAELSAFESGGHLAQLASQPAATLLDYLSDKGILLALSPESLEEHVNQFVEQISEDDPFFQDWDHWQRQAERKGLTRVELHEQLQPVEPSQPDTAKLQSESQIFQSLETYRPLGKQAPEVQVAEAQRLEFFSQLHRWLRQGYHVYVFCNNQGERQRFEEIWREYGLGNLATGEQNGASGSSADIKAGEQQHQTATQKSGSRKRPKRKASSKKRTGSSRANHELQRLKVAIGSLSRGFLCEASQVVVVTDAEIFGRYKVQRPRRLKSHHAPKSRSALDIDFSELEEGDYVVHVQYGIARYLGLTTISEAAGTRSSSGKSQKGPECLVLEFAPTQANQPAPKLYVPVTEAHLVSKYVGTGKAHPKLNTLTGTRWTKAKAQAAQAVQDLASEFLSIQAARESQSGHTFSEDTSWQLEFENAFLYEETPDQMRAIDETKGDLESRRPMDRLICGDVGYGKTEVAIRGAFKAVMDGKQVALLVPTTVLAQQHYNTFCERMADYPVRIDLLSRFRSRKQQRQTLEALAAGSVDIVIGTHRLLQKDITFKDLGLVIIDEEQRFGVLHKEKFKKLRRMVDVLTLSATPIPRTLYLALTGARDMSTIETPPQDRLPVQTIVTQYDDRVIRDAIQRELNREGQVFFLHNRVSTIHTMRDKVKTLVPHARLLVAHGQMESDDLETIMTQFVNGEADVLLCTNIIESGLDIPNANTIIIDRADRFGLSDLYQLRGRVGRYKHQAYAYILIPRHAKLLTDVRKRISAIKQHSSLGSGFKIAMRDLEIRGAGNLLGAEQSGHIAAVGFELYCQLLKQSVSALKGEKLKPRLEVHVHLDFLSANPSSDTSENAAACIPYHYIPDSRQRIEIYRRLAQVMDKQELDELRTEIRDRFGAPPPGVELLLQITELKSLARDRQITSIETREGKIMLTRDNDYIMFGKRFPRLSKKEPAARLKEIKRLLLSL